MPPQKKFVAKITKQLEHHDLEQYRSLLEDLFTADQDQEDIAAAMLMLLQGKQKLILPPDPPMEKRRRERNDRGDRRENPRSAERRGERKATEIHKQWIYIVSKSVVQMV